jgi:TatD DNase family protein
MMIDTHTHLNIFEPADREKQIQTAKELGTSLFIEVAGNAKNAPKVLELANSRDDFYCGVAVHPFSVESYDRDHDIPLFRKLIKENNKVVCVGECGMDYSASPSTAVAEKMRQEFRDMIRLAREFNLPLNMHTDRLSSRDLLTILREEKGYEVGGMIHNFGGNITQAREYLDMGFYISVSVLIQHPLADRLRTIFHDVSIGQMVMDSDAPGAKLERVGESKEPYPYDMDKHSEPRMLRYICDKLGEVKGLPLETVESITSLNAQRLFRLPKLA